MKFSTFEHLLLCDQATVVYRHRRAGDERRSVRTQPHDSICNLLWLAHPADRLMAMRPASASVPTRGSTIGVRMTPGHTAFTRIPAFA